MTQKPQYTEIFSSAGQKTRIVLPDSSPYLNKAVQKDGCNLKGAKETNTGVSLKFSKLKDGTID
ncbi:MAG: hypothetical protein AB2L20_18685 [Mangrovibacterium sp.]